MNAVTTSTTCKHGLGFKCLACYPIQYTVPGVVPPGVPTVHTPRTLNAQPLGTDYSIRYDCYARANGMTPDARRMKDVEQGSLNKSSYFKGFILFLDKMLEEACKERPDLFAEGHHGMVLKSQIAFTDWLLSKYPNPSSRLLQQRLLNATKDIENEPK